MVALASTLGASVAGELVANLGSSKSHSRNHHSSHSNHHLHHKSRGSHGKSHVSKHDKHDHLTAKMGVTAKCQNVPADNAAGTFQYQDPKCGKGAIGSVPGCMGDKSNCRFCQTSIVPKKSRNEGWPTCPQEVCSEMKALGCKGESKESKKEVLWHLAREKAIKHNKIVTGISTGKCATAPADRKIGTHQFSDNSCLDVAGGIGPGCLGRGSTCRFCQLSTAKHQNEGWPTCPDVVCKKWKVKGGGCEPPLALVEVPPKHPPSDFDPKAAIKAAEKKMATVIFEQQHPAEAEHSKGSKGDGLIKKTEPTGDEVVDLLQSKGRGKNGSTNICCIRGAASRSRKSRKRAGAVSRDQSEHFRVSDPKQF